MALTLSNYNLFLLQRHDTKLHLVQMVAHEMHWYSLSYRDIAPIVTYILNRFKWKTQCMRWHHYPQLKEQKQYEYLIWLKELIRNMDKNWGITPSWQTVCRQLLYWAETPRRAFCLSLAWSVSGAPQSENRKKPLIKSLFKYYLLHWAKAPDMKLTSCPVRVWILSPVFPSRKSCVYKNKQTNKGDVEYCSLIHLKYMMEYKWSTHT